MAKNPYSTSMPLDQPNELGGGLTHVEADFQGFPQRGRGFGQGLGGDSAIGAAKGDRVREGVPGPAELDEAFPARR